MSDRFSVAELKALKKRLRALSLNHNADCTAYATVTNHRRKKKLTRVTGEKLTVKPQLYDFIREENRRRLENVVSVEELVRDLRRKQQQEEEMAAYDAYAMMKRVYHQRPLLCELARNPQRPKTASAGTTIPPTPQIPSRLDHPQTSEPPKSESLSSWNETHKTISSRTTGAEIQRKHDLHCKHELSRSSKATSEKFALTVRELRQTKSQPVYGTKNTGDPYAHYCADSVKSLHHVLISTRSKHALSVGISGEKCPENITGVSGGSLKSLKEKAIVLESDDESVIDDHDYEYAAKSTCKLHAPQILSRSTQKINSKSDTFLQARKPGDIQEPLISNVGETTADETGSDDTDASSQHSSDHKPKCHIHNPRQQIRRKAACDDQFSGLVKRTSETGGRTDQLKTSSVFPTMTRQLANKGDRFYGRNSTRSTSYLHNFLEQEQPESHVVTILRLPRLKGHRIKHDPGSSLPSRTTASDKSESLYFDRRYYDSGGDRPNEFGWESHFDGHSDDV